MGKIAVVYWSGTGNTEAMAQAVAEGAREKGAKVAVFTPTEFDSAMVEDFDANADKVREMVDALCAKYPLYC